MKKLRIITAIIAFCATCTAFAGNGGGVRPPSLKELYCSVFNCESVGNGLQNRGSGGGKMPPVSTESGGGGGKIPPGNTERGNGGGVRPPQ